MILAESCPLGYGVPQLQNGLLEVHRSKISLHRASAEYSYPTVRLPHYLAKSLAGLSTRIYQTVHDGALAFLVVINTSSAGSEHTSENHESSVLTWRRSPVRIRPGPLFFCGSDTLEPSIDAFSLARIMTRNKHNKDKKPQL